MRQSSRCTIALMTRKTSEIPPPATGRFVDPVIEAYKPGIDRTVLRHNLRLTVEQRIDGLVSLMRSIEQMEEMGRKARERQ